MSSSSDAGTTWSTPVTVSDRGRGAATWPHRPQITGSADGTHLTITWLRSDGSNDRVQVSSSDDAGTTWSTPVTLSDPGQHAQHPQVTGSADGTKLTTTWDRGGVVQVSSSSDAGATWSTPVTLSDPGQWAYSPQITGSADGTKLTTTWSRSDGSWYRAQVSSSSDAGATWSTPVTLSDAGQNTEPPQVTGSADGTKLTTTWTRRGGYGIRLVQVSSSGDAGATWSTPVTVSDAGHDVRHLQITGSADGTKLATMWVWSDGTNYRVQVSSSGDAGATWSTPVTLSDTGQHDYTPQITGSADGTKLAATWLGSDGRTLRVQVSSLVPSDSTPPVVTGSTSPDANGAGWFKTAVVVDWSAVDDVDGDLVSPESVTVSGEGADQAATSAEVCDSAGNCATGEVTGISIDTTIPVVDDALLGVSPIAVGETTDLTVSASDALSGVTAGEWFRGADPGEGAATALDLDAGVLSTSVDAGSDPGVYQIGVRAQDEAGNWSETTTVYLVVYDPSGGFAIGGGWMIPGGSTSDPGDALPGLDGSSKANFGFVVKYEDGASTVPSGNLQFKYKAGDFKLKSSGMDWLVVTNNNWAKFQGVGVVDGLDGEVPFRVDARDANKADQSDRFIIRIWAPGADPEVDEPLYKASGDVEGGQIKTHKN